MGIYWVAARKSIWPPDFGGYQLGAIISSLNTPANPVLQDVPFTVSNLGGGNYRLSWTVPAGAQNYRVKWSPLLIAPSTGLLNFDVLSNTFGLNPDQYDTWFGANSVNEPIPGAPGTTQTLDITGTGSTSLTAQNFCGVNARQPDAGQRQRADRHCGTGARQSVGGACGGR
jgi:hypothetical protein